MMGPIMGGLPRLKFGTATAVAVFHGNSLVYGQSGATQSMVVQVQNKEPFWTGVTCINRGTNGLRTYQMTAEFATKVTPSLSSTKDNILVFWEGRNSIYNGGRTPADAWAEVAVYCEQALAANPDLKIVLLTCIPQRLDTDTDEKCAADNAKFDAFNDLMRANWRAVGAKALVDVVAPGSPFRGLRSVADFTGIQHLWSPAETIWVHLSNAGYAVIADYVAAALQRLPRR